MENRFMVTPKALDILDTVTDIVEVDEYLTHDGFDRYGPQSDIWMLEVYTFTDSRPYLHLYSWENWYQPGDSEAPYELIKTYTLDSMNPHSEYYEKLVKILTDKNTNK
jgi:hypothetical protein